MQNKTIVNYEKKIYKFKIESIDWIKFIFLKSYGKLLLVYKTKSILANISIYRNSIILRWHKILQIF